MWLSLRSIEQPDFCESSKVLCQCTLEYVDLICIHLTVRWLHRVRNVVNTDKALFIVLRFDIMSFLYTDTYLQLDHLVRRTTYFQPCEPVLIFC